jgi:single-strand DNA-binding protein
MANKIILTGFCIKAPEIFRNTGDKGTTVGKFPFSFSTKKTGAGEWAELPIIVIGFDKKAEFIEKFVEKGRKYLVIGRLSYQNYPDSQGIVHKKAEIYAEEIEFWDSKKEGSARQPEQRNEGGGSGEGFYPVEDDDELPF